jgi:tetratricopeptide (TPR) repeat protein
MAPSFAEGYNKRATVYYLLQEYEEAIQDCRSTLALNPYHFGALSGLGLCYAALQDLESALFWFEKAFTLHPGLLLVSSLSSAHLSLLICSICLNDEELGCVFVRRWVGG